MGDPNSYQAKPPMPTPNTGYPLFKQEPSTSQASFSPMGIYTASSSALSNKVELPSSTFPNSPRSVSRLSHQYGNLSMTNLPPNRNMHQTQVWMQNHYLDGNYPSPSPSVAPSVMSNLSCMSIPDDVSMLSVNTQMSGVSQFMDRRHLHTPNRQPSSASSCVENVDPNEKSDPLDEILNAITDTEMQVRDKAIHVIRVFFNRCNNRNLNRTKLKQLVGAIIHLINEYLPDVQKYNKQLRELVDCLLIFSSQTHVDVLRELLVDQGERSPLIITLCMIFENCVERFEIIAVTIMRSLASDQRNIATLSAIKRAVRQRPGNVFMAKLLERIKQMVNKMDLNNHILYYVDVLRVLIKGVNVQKQFVIENDGMRLLLKIMTPRPNPVNGVDKLKYSVLATILSLISSDTQKFSENFVECNGIDILTNDLAHQYSPLTMKMTMQIFCTVSDAKGLKEKKLDNPLRMVLYELGKKADSVVIKYATGFICNMPGKDLHTKEFLTTNGAITILLDLIKPCLMALYGNHSPSPDKQADVLEILENCLIALVNLSSNSNVVLSNAFKIISKHPDVLTIIGGILQHGSAINQRRIITILQRMCLLDMKYMDELKCFDELTKLLFHIIWSNARMCNEEKRLREREVVDKAINILTLLWNKNPSYAECILSIAKKDYNLFSLLNMVSNVDTCILILNFIDQMCKDERIRMYYSSDQQAVSIAEMCTRSTEPGLEAVGVSLIKKLRQDSDVSFISDEYNHPLVGVLMESDDYPLI